MSLTETALAPSVVTDARLYRTSGVNGERVEMAKLNHGDRLRVGSILFTFEQEPSRGTQTILREVEHEMSAGKGYTTLLREIVQDVEEPAPDAAPSAATAAEAEPPPAEPAARPRKTVRIRRGAKKSGGETD